MSKNHAKPVRHEKQLPPPPGPALTPPPSTYQAALDKGRLALNIIALLFMLATGLGAGNIQADPWVPELAGVLVAIGNLIITWLRRRKP